MIGSLRKATPDQRRFLYGLVRTYDMAHTGEIPVQRFWDVTLEEWLTRWPLVPGLVDCGVLPPTALEGVLSEAQQALVDAERATVYTLMKRTMKKEWESWREELLDIAAGISD